MKKGSIFSDPSAFEQRATASLCFALLVPQAAEKKMCDPDAVEKSGFVHAKNITRLVTRNCFLQFSKSLIDGLKIIRHTLFLHLNASKFLPRHKFFKSAVRECGTV